MHTYWNTQPHEKDKHTHGKDVWNAYGDVKMLQPEQQLGLQFNA